MNAIKVYTPTREIYNEVLTLLQKHKVQLFWLAGFESGLDYLGFTYWVDDHDATDGTTPIAEFQLWSTALYTVEELKEYLENREA